MAEDISLQLSSWIKKVVKFVDKDIVTRPVLQSIGKDVADRIRLRTRLGFGVKSNGAVKQSLKGMRVHTKEYTQFRKDNSGSLSGLTSASKHNLTLSGQMLDSLRETSVDSSGKKIEIGFTNDFAQLKADVNSTRGWKFLHLSDVEIKAVNNFYRREVEKLVKRQNLD